MTLHEVLERAAEMNALDRRKLVEMCGIHDIAALPRTSTGVNPGPPYFCPLLHVFSPSSLRAWNPPDTKETSAE